MAHGFRASKRSRCSEHTASRIERATRSIPHTPTLSEHSACCRIQRATRIQRPTRSIPHTASNCLRHSALCRYPHTASNTRNGAYRRIQRHAQCRIQPHRASNTLNPAYSERNTLHCSMRHLALCSEQHAQCRIQRARRCAQK